MKPPAFFNAAWQHWFASLPPKLRAEVLAALREAWDAAGRGVARP